MAIHRSLNVQKKFYAVPYVDRSTRLLRRAKWGNRQAFVPATLDFAALQHVYFFEDQECNDLQAATLCEALARSICGCIHTPAQMAYPYDGSASSMGGAPTPLASDASLSLVKSAMQHIEWFPEYGAALISLHGGNSDRFAPFHVICLDQWETHLHRVYADGPHLPPRLQSTAVCKGSAVHIINTSLEPNQSNVSRLGSFVRKILEHSHTSTKKAPNTAGFLAAVVAQAAGILDSQPLAHGNADTEIMYERAISNSTAAGVFRDVGRRAGSQRLPTCWPLVQEAFRFVASQASSLDPDVLLCQFHTHQAVALSGIAVQSQQPSPCMEFSAAMQSLRAAAAVLAVAAQGMTSSPTAIKAASAVLVACRTDLDAAMQRRQHETLQPAFPGLLSFEAEEGACRPFTTSLPSTPSAGFGRVTGDTDRPLLSLSPLPALTFQESSDINYLLPWIASIPDAVDHQALALMLHLTEQWFFSQACHVLGSKRCLPVGDITAMVDLLGIYSQRLQRFEQLMFRTGDDHTDVLAVELRSRETLITWIAMCFAHQQAAYEWPQLRKFSLPVQADDLRHLVVSDCLASEAVRAVAAYVSFVNCNSIDRPVFSTRTDATVKLASAFAHGNEALTKQLNEEIRVSVARIEEHWEAIVQKQQLVTVIQEKLSVAQKSLANAKLDKVMAAKTLDNKINEAQARSEALQSKTAHHKSQVISAIMEFYNRSRARSAADAEKDRKVKAAVVAWRKSNAYVQQLRNEKKNGCPGEGSLAGQAFHNAQQNIVAAEENIKKLEAELEQARVVPARVWQALPDCRLPGPARDSALTVLFFLHPEHCGSLPILQQLCCAAQQGVVPWPLRSPAGVWDASSLNTREPAHASWREFYQSTSATAAFQQRLLLFEEDEDPEQLTLYTTFHAPAAADLGPADVMAYRSKLDGVWFPQADGLRLVWRGGPVARYSSARSAIDPFADPAGHPAASAQAFTEPGKFWQWMLTHANGPSQICQRALPSAADEFVQCGCSDMRSSGINVLADRSHTFDLTRGNRSLAEMAGRHPDMTADQWLTFAGLRAYPHTQLRRICVGLRDGTLLLSSPQVCAAVRMALYQVGQLERRTTGSTADCVVCAWHDFPSDLAALCSELHRWHERILQAPKFLLQAPLLCEMAAFVSSRHESGPDVADAFAQMAASWASQYEAELHSLETEAADDAGSSRPDVQAKCALAHALVVITHGSSSRSMCAPASTVKSNLSNQQAERLCFHMVQAARHSRYDCAPPLQQQLKASMRYCARVMASHLHTLDALLANSADTLSRAARGVFAELPADAPWRPVSGAQSCYVTQFQGSTYSVYLLTGQALRNGCVPGQLPSGILEHPEYKRAFGNAVFEVTAETVGDDVLYRSSRSIGGRLYSWMLQGQRLTVYETPVNAKTGQAILEAELELLPFDCKWCSGLPQRLKQLHSHWLSRSTGAVILRGVPYDDHAIHFILAPADDPEAPARHCLVVPSHRQSESWPSLLSSATQLDVMWETPKESATIVLLTRFEAQQYIHVTSSNKGDPNSARVLRFHLPRFRLQFQLTQGSHSLASQQYADYHVPPTSHQKAEDRPILPPGLQEFLLLRHSDPGLPDRLLVPDGTISGASKASRLSVAVPAALSSTAVELQHHVFTRNSHTCHLETDVMQSRLFLAALHAAADLRVPLPSLGMTGGEHALHLVRRCHVSRPMTPREAATLQSVRDFAAHTPALTLMCASMLAASQALSFLHSHPGSGVAASVRPDEILLYRQQVKRAAEVGHSNPRRVLTPHEAVQFACLPPSMPWQAGVVTWEMIDTCMDSCSRRCLHDAGTRVFHARLEHIASCHLTESADVPIEHLKQMRPGLKRLRGSAHGQEIARVHEESLQAFLASPSPCNMAGVNLLQLRSDLEVLAEDVGTAVDVIRQTLLEALGCNGDAVEGAVLAAMRSACGAAAPAPADLIQATIFPGLLKALNPLLADEARKKLVEHMLLWQELCVLQDKLARCMLRCDVGAASQAGGMDASLGALEQELTNRREWSAAENPEWLAFEVLQRVEIRHRQYVVAKHMLENSGGPGMGEAKKGGIVQLNMGEGKTRVILPMLVLALSGRGQLVRLNFLQELLPEAVDYLHTCLTGSILQVRLVAIPFSRNIEMDSKQLQMLSQQMRECLSSRAFVCVSREHRMSLALKSQEVLSRGDMLQHGILQDLLSLPGWDILDECDQLLSHKFQLVYAWGAQTHLPGLEARVQMAQAVLEALAFDTDCLALLSDPAIAHIQHNQRSFGSLPQIRLISGAKLQAHLEDIHRALCKALFYQHSVKITVLSWLTALSPDRYRDFQDCCMNTAVDFNGPAAKLGISQGCAEREQVLALRGLIGMRVLEHTLQRRHRVDFGLTERVGQGATRMAVPFRACDTPSERAEFKHPDAAIVKTQVAYYQAGLQAEQLREALMAALSLPVLQGENVFRAAVEESRRHLEHVEDIAELRGIDELAKIDLSNSVQFQVLLKFLSRNFRIINFWLSACVLPQETRQFPESLRCTAWHAASSQSGKVVGFSGTVDNRSLLPLQVQVQDTTDLSIRGTDGRMTSTLLLPGKCTFVNLTDQPSVSMHASMSVSMQVLQFAIDHGANAIIDAGAQLAEMELHDVAQHLVDTLTERQREEPASVTAEGVVFFQAAETTGARSLSKAQAGWYVMDMHGSVMPKHRCPIAEADAFVLFDEAHCRGSDMKLRPDACAVLTLGPHMGREKLVQAAARMRQLEKQQSVILLGTEEACRSIREKCELACSTEIQPKHVLEWVLCNTAEAHFQGLGEYLLQGKHYAATLGKDVFTDEETSDLIAMYEQPARPSSVMDFLQQPIVKNGSIVPLSADGEQCMALLQQHVQPFGGGGPVNTASIADEFERDVQLQQEQEQERELQEEQRVPFLDTQPERHWLDVTCALSLSTASDFSAQQGVDAIPIAEALQQLPSSARALAEEADIMSTMNWPPAVLTTRNFLNPSSQRAVVASHVRKADALLLFPDGSALLLSERECELVVRALRQQPAAANTQVLLVHLACAQEMGMTAHNAGNSDACGRLGLLSAGNRGIVADPFIAQRVQQALVAAQLFNGETEFGETQPDMRLMSQGSGAALRWLVFGVGDRQCRCVLSGREGRDAAHQLVRAREQAMCWPGSALEAVCQRQISAENVEAGGNRSPPKWGWVSPASPFLK